MTETLSQFVFDRKGRKYRLDVIAYGDEGFDLWLHCHIPFAETTVGWAKCRPTSAETMVLGDIIIHDPPLVHPRGIGRLVPHTLWHSLVKSYRRQGLGT